MTAYLFILLSSACSLAVVHLLKVAEAGELRTLNTLTVNYLAAFLFTFIVDLGLPLERFASLSLPVWIFIFITGAFFIGNFLAYSKSAHLNGIGVSVAAMRVSLLVPVLISVLIYGEAVTLRVAAGLLLVFGALYFMIPKTRPLKIRNVNAAWLLVIIFILSGFADGSLKIYEEDLSGILSERGFVGMVFFSAFCIGTAVILFRGGPLVRVKELAAGAAIGIPNLYSAIFLIYALQEIDGVVAYPVVNILNVIGGALLGIWWWKDRVTLRQWAGMIAAIAAIIILV